MIVPDDSPQSYASNAFRSASSAGQPLLRVLQIGVHAEQLQSCRFEPYLNSVPSIPEESYLFFESRVLAEAVQRGEHRAAKYFGVVSHRFEQKLESARAWRLPNRNVGRLPFTTDRFTQFVAQHATAPIIALARTVPHSVFGFAEIMHPGITAATRAICAQIGVVFEPRALNPSPIYFNYFVAQRDLLEDFVTTVLSPAIQAVAQSRELQRLLRRDAGYHRPWPAELAKLYGLGHYPLHAFIAERLINVYLQRTSTPVVYYDTTADLGWPLCWYSYGEPIHRRMVGAVLPLLKAWRRWSKGDRSA